VVTGIELTIQEVFFTQKLDLLIATALIIDITLISLARSDKVLSKITFGINRWITVIAILMAIVIMFIQYQTTFHVEQARQNNKVLALEIELAEANGHKVEIKNSILEEQNKNIHSLENIKNITINSSFYIFLLAIIFIKASTFVSWTKMKIPEKNLNTKLYRSEEKEQTNKSKDG